LNCWRSSWSVAFAGGEQQPAAEYRQRLPDSSNLIADAFAALPLTIPEAPVPATPGEASRLTPPAVPVLPEGLPPRAGRFREALADLRKGNDLGRSQPGWPSEGLLALIGQVERFADLDRDLPAFLAGERKPAGPTQQLELAVLCQHPARRLYAASARFYAGAFAADGALAENDVGHRTNAACVAVLAGLGQGEDRTKPADTERARLRRQALDWLRADLVARTKRVEGGKPQDRATAIGKLTHWGKDPDLAAVRDKDGLDRLPEDERQAWQQFWADTAALLQQAQKK
jgi:hypothetical protein